MRRPGQGKLDSNSEPPPQYGGLLHVPAPVPVQHSRPTCCRMAPLSTSPCTVSLVLSRMLRQGAEQRGLQQGQQLVSCHERPVSADPGPSLNLPTVPPRIECMQPFQVN